MKEFRLILMLALGLWCLFMLVSLEETDLMGPMFLLVAWGITFWLFLANGLIGLIFLIFRHKRPVICVRIGVACLLFLPISLLYLPLGKLWWKHNLAVAETYPARAEPALEAYKQAQGHYPEELDELPAHFTLPRGLTYSKYAEQDGYFFSYPDWDAFFGAYLYDSHTKQWEFDKDDD